MKHLKIFTLVYDPASQAVDDSELVRSLEGRDVVSVTDHFFT